MPVSIIVGCTFFVDIINTAKMGTDREKTQNSERWFMNQDAVNIFLGFLLSARPVASFRPKHEK
jgi:hypothetical protein